jgi:LacI family transcriptional regulator
MVKFSGAVATINDVARHAGVSKRTVSRVLNESSNVNETTRQRILEVIKELDYSPSAMAQGLASRRSYLIGMLFDDPNAAVIHSIQKGALKACAQHGYALVVKPIDFRSEDLIEEVIKFVRRSKLEGLIILPPISNNDELANALIQNNIGYVRIGAKIIDDPSRMLISQDRLAMQQVVDTFVQAGRSNIAIVAGPQERLASSERLEGLQSALALHGLALPSHYIVQGNFTYESGFECADALFDLELPPNAIFASNDQMAIGLIHKAQDRGVRVPEDVMVIGYDNDPMSARLRPGLSTLARPNELMAESAALRLIQNASSDQAAAPPEFDSFLPTLIHRQSTASM